MTLDEIAYNILNLLRGGRTHNDELISIDQIKFNIQHYRAMLIRRDYARNGYVSKTIEQDLGCIFLRVCGHVQVLWYGPTNRLYCVQNR